MTDVRHGSYDAVSRTLVTPHDRPPDYGTSVLSVDQIVSPFYLSWTQKVLQQLDDLIGTLTG